MRVVGLAVVGRLGNISSLALGPIVAGGRELGRLFADGEIRDAIEVLPAHGVFFWPFARLEAPPRAGKGLLLLLTAARALPQLPWRETAEREDCAVEDLRRRTRLPEASVPLLVVLGERPGRTPAGPGKEG